MVFYPYSTLNDQAAPQASDVAWQVGQQAADFVCGVWQNNAGFLTGVPDPTGIGAFNTGVLDSLCTPRNVPEPQPEQEFEGGQCDIFYTIVVAFGSSRGGPNDQPQTTPINGTAVYQSVRGPIGGGLVRGNPGGDGYQGAVLVPPQSIAPDGFLIVWAGSAAEYDQYEGAFTAVTAVTPTSGEPDICGDPEPRFPIVLPAPLFISAPINLQVGPISIPTTINFNRPTFSPRFNFSPRFEVSAGPFLFEFDLGGLQVGFNPTINFPPRENPPLLPPSSPTGGGGEGNDRPVDKADKDEITDQLDEIEECACDEPPDPPVQRSLTFSGKGDSIAVNGRISRVVLNVTTVGKGVRTQFGSGNAPDVLYLGWHAFGANTAGQSGDRRPISFQSNVFYPDADDCGVFTYSLVFDSICQGTIFYEVDQES